ncbi:hypothetical protein ACODNH_19875 (plasmid) [Haloarcula sp. NS06]|uniref:hypothetical protein n=1 Tax=Haloarcula sp. NS06 TaxID=3409688 RepID=UPI003DA780E7
MFASTRRLLAGVSLVTDGLADGMQQQRIEADFAAGIQFAMDWTNSEIRAFVPAQRKSPEAFFAAGSFESADNIQSFTDEIRVHFDSHDGWAIRCDTSTGPFLEYFDDEPGCEELSLMGDEWSLSNPDRAVVRVPSYPLAGAAVDELMSIEGNYTIVVSETNSIDHIDWDIMIVVTEKAERPSFEIYPD